MDICSSPVRGAFRRSSSAADPGVYANAEARVTRLTFIQISAATAPDGLRMTRHLSMPRVSQTHVTQLRPANWETGGVAGTFPGALGGPGGKGQSASPTMSHLTLCRYYCDAHGAERCEQVALDPRIRWIGRGQLADDLQCLLLVQTPVLRLATSLADSTAFTNIDLAL